MSTKRPHHLRQPKSTCHETCLMSGSDELHRPALVKCRQCICGIETDDDIWCAVLKRIPSRKDAKRCRRFCPRALLEETPGDPRGV